MAGTGAGEHSRVATRTAVDGVVTRTAGYPVVGGVADNGVCHGRADNVFNRRIQRHGHIGKRPVAAGNFAHAAEGAGRQIDIDARSER